MITKCFLKYCVQRMPQSDFLNDLLSDCLEDRNEAGFKVILKYLTDDQREQLILSLYPVNRVSMELIPIDK